MGRYRFLLRPRWLALHIVALLLAVAMISLGFWQLRRLDEKRDHNRLLDERSAVAVVDVAGGPSPAPQDTDGLTYRTGVAVGVYQPDDEVLVRSRSLGGDPGAWVLTPLRLRDGRELVVNRGWIPASGPPQLPAEAAAPGGEVTVRGLLMATQVRGSFGPRDPVEGRLTSLARADLGRLQAQVSAPLYPLYLQLQAQDPPPTDLPVILPAPDRDEGPHLGYAVQWFLFTVIGVTGYTLMIRKTAREEAIAAHLPTEGPAGDGGSGDGGSGDGGSGDGGSGDGAGGDPSALAGTAARSTGR